MSVQNSYVQSNVSLYIDFLSDSAEPISRLFKSCICFADWNLLYNHFRANVAGVETCSNVAHSLEEGKKAFSCLRLFFSVEGLLSGKLIWKRDEDTGAWKYEGEKAVSQSFFSMTINIQILAARFLTVIKWLHEQDVLDLGKHAEQVSNAITNLWKSVLTLAIAGNVWSIYNEPNLQERVKSAVDAGCCIIDTADFYCDFKSGLDLVPSPIPPLVFFQLFIKTLSALAPLVKEAVYYQPRKLTISPKGDNRV